MNDRDPWSEGNMERLMIAEDFYQDTFSLEQGYSLWTRQSTTVLQKETT